MTTPLFLLRCLEIGLSIRDLDYLTIGMVMDIWTEKGNDSVKYDSIGHFFLETSFGSEDCFFQFFPQSDPFLVSLSLSSFMCRHSPETQPVELFLSSGPKISHPSLSFTYHHAPMDDSFS